MDVIVLDAVWTAEFAANRWVDELPEAGLGIPAFLPPAVETGKYRWQPARDAVPHRHRPALLPQGSGRDAPDDLGGDEVRL